MTSVYVWVGRFRWIDLATESSVDLATCSVKSLVKQWLFRKMLVGNHIKKYTLGVQDHFLHGWSHFV